MTDLEEFFVSYLHYSVSQRLFEDRCRQMIECNGTAEERQALVDETLRLAMCVTNNVIDTETLLAEAVEQLHEEGGDPDLIDAMSLISNNLREDRDRADNYTLFVTSRRAGNRVRKPRKPRVANPFVFVPEKETVEPIQIQEKKQPETPVVAEDGTGDSPVPEAPEPVPVEEVAEVTEDIVEEPVGEEPEDLSVEDIQEPEETYGPDGEYIEEDPEGNPGLKGKIQRILRRRYP